MLIGIDLGTTFSVVSYLNDEGKAEVVVNRDGERTTPSVVMFEDGTITVGEQAKENSFITPYNVCQFVKRQMGKKSFNFEVSMDESYTAEEISAMILKRLKEDAENATGEKVDGVVVTVPAYFDDPQRQSTHDAGQIAGLNVLGIINEPTAAAVAYSYGQADNDGNVMVFDLGGGTFDITIMKLSNNLRQIDTLATFGNKNLGGFNFDNEIINKVVAEFKDATGISIDMDDVAYQELRLKAENAKKALSVRTKASISMSCGGKTHKVEITREEFDDMIRGYVDTTKAGMEIALDEAGLTWADISKILLVGGSTRIPAFQNMIKEVSGISPSHELNPDEAVSIGAAYYAGIIAGKKQMETPVPKQEMIKITDVNSHSLGIAAKNRDTGELLLDIILPKNTPIPGAGQKEFVTASDMQEYLDIKVYEGEDPDIEYDTLVGECTLEITPRPKGSPILVSMNYDENGIIHVYVKDLIDDSDLGEMRIERASNLSGSEINSKKDLLSTIDIE